MTAPDPGPVPADPTPEGGPMPVEQAIAWARGYTANPGKERRREVRALLVEIHAVRGQLADSTDAVNELRAENERLRDAQRRWISGRADDRP